MLSSAMLSDHQMGRGPFVVCPPLSLVSVWPGCCGRHSDNQMGRGSFVVCPPLSLVSVWPGLWPSLRPSDGTRILCGLSTSVPSVCVVRFVAVTQTTRWDEDPLWSVHLSVPSVCVVRFVAVTQTTRWDEDPLWSVHLCP